MSAWTLTLSFVGGLGLFMLGMRMMTDGLKVAAGRLLRDLLARWTRTKLRAFGTGVGLTAIVQSSTAVTIATIGFVNAGILDLSQALWVIYGANLGTTSTAWLVGATGVAVDLKALALPFIGAGMLLRMTGPRARRGALGDAIAGFGLFFLGLDILQGSFTSLGESVDLSAIEADGVLGSLAFFGIGVVVTLLTQSSTATIAIVMTAATGGVVSLQAAGALIIGANVGTTSTAVFAAIGATPAARRAASGHVAFSVLAAVAALALLPWMLDALHALMPSVGGTLALFHTAVNALGVLLIIPLSGGLERELSRRFGTEGEQKGKPRYLDPTILAIPAVALTALVREMARAGRHAGEIVALSLEQGRPNAAPLEDRRESFERLLEAIARFITNVDRSELSEPTALGLATLVRVSRHYRTAVEQAALVAAMRESALDEGAEAARFDGELGEGMRHLVAMTDPERDGFALNACEQALGAVEDRYERERATLRDAAARGAIPAETAMTAYHLLGEARRAVRQLVEAAEDLDPLRR